MRGRFMAWLVLLLAPLAGAQQDWKAAAKAALERGDLPAALAITDARLRQSPDDLEARTQHGRALAWSGKWAQAEAEYRQVLQYAPHDADVLVALADVLLWQGRREDSLAALEDAASRDTSAELFLRRGRILAQLNRRAEAAEAFRAVLRRDPRNREARAQLEALREFRHELRVGAVTEVFNIADATAMQAFAWRARWSQPWSTEFAFSAHQRFGYSVQRFSFQVNRRFAKHSWASLGAVHSTSGDVLARRELYGEIGRAFTLPNRWIRGMELGGQQRGLWFDSASIAVTSFSTLLYLPRDWNLLLRLSGARSSFSSAGAEWQPSGGARLAIPLVPCLEARLSFAVGAENFSVSDRLGHFSAREFGGGVRVRLNPWQEFFVNVSRQQRSRGVTQTSVGVSYAYRF